MADEPKDEWLPVADPDQPDEWQPVPQPERLEGSALSLIIPEAFKTRVRQGEAIARIVSRAGEGIKHGFGESDLGFSPEVVSNLQGLGIYHDPLRGRPTPLQFVNEAVMQPTAAAVDFVFRSMSAGVHGMGGVVGQVVDEMGGRGKAAERETINFLNMAMIEAGFGRFSRMRTPLENEISSLKRENAIAGTPIDEVVGGLPRDPDFKTAADLVGKPEVSEPKLRQMWEQDGIHPAEVWSDASRDVWLRKVLTDIETDPALKLPAEAWTPENLARASEAGELKLPSNAGPATDPPLVPPSVQPLAPPGRLIAAAQNSAELLLDVGHELQMWGAPMARGSVESMALTKDFANSLRRNNWDWARLHDDITKRFTPEQWRKMWEAADEESVMRQLGETSEERGLARLDPVERAVVEDLHTRAMFAWMRALDLGMVQGDGLPAYTPRMLVGLAEQNLLELDQIGRNLFTRTPQMRRRKYLTAEETEAAAKKISAEAEIVRDIRVLPMAIAKLENAIAGRTLMEGIKEIGKNTGTDTLVEGWRPGKDWFTISNHPAFRTRRNEPKTIEIAGPRKTASIHEMSIDPGLQAGLERVASELKINIKQPLRSQDPYLAQNPDTAGYTSRTQGDVVSTFGNAQTIIEHEIGHKIDFRYGLSQKIHAQSPAAWKELGELALHRVSEGQRAPFRAQPDYLKKLGEHTPYGGSKGYGDYLLSAEERIANMLHAYWYTPKLLEKVAPNAFKWFENFLADAPDPLKRAIKSVEPSLRIEMKRQQDVATLSAPTKIRVDQWRDVPIYVRGDFEGPLRAVLDRESSLIYNGMMVLKGKTMGLIMNSPAIHNMVEWGRALPAMPGKVATFKVYFEGNRAKHNVEIMHEAINHGLVPIGKRFFNQDITGIMEAPSLAPGRSWTADVLAFIPGLFDEGAGAAVKRSIDTAGNFWHNTLLWDRIGDLQMGLYVNMRDSMLAKGVDRNLANYMAAHWANRYAGALPKEAMSDAATKISNFLLFSRSFTMGNLGVMKDMLTGLPKDVLAQIERDSGFTRGAIEHNTLEPGTPGGEAARFAKSMAMRKATAIVALDIGLMYIMNSLLQSMSNVIIGDVDASDELRGYSERFLHELQNMKAHPSGVLLPGAGIPIVSPLAAVHGVLGVKHLLEETSATSENEPGLAERVKVGHAKDGTAVYARWPVGKIGEEFTGIMGGPIDMAKRKMGTIARPAWQVFANDAGFGRKIYDPTADTGIKHINNAARIAWHFFKAQTPEGQINAVIDLVKGDGDPALNAAQAFGPVAGITFRKGAPGGEAVGEMYHARQQHDFAVQIALPDIRKQIQRGDVDGARDHMTELGIPPALQRFYINTSLDPSTRLSRRALRDFYLYSTPEQRERLENAR